MKRLVLSWLLAAAAAAVQAGMGTAQLPGLQGDSDVTVFYPTDAADQPQRRGPFTIPMAPQAAPVKGNGRLVVISHGSGGNAWVHTDLARTLVQAGFVVAMPLHRGDNAFDSGNPGPDSWKLRPAEVSRAIDAVAATPRFASLLALDKVGVFGQSAGAHTALSLAGGRWSPALFKQHCERNLAQDFPACVGLATRLTGGTLDGLKKTVALGVLRQRFDEGDWQVHHDPRIAAAVAGVPAAADFDPASLATPRVPLALVTAGRDQWLRPQFHSEPVLQACLPRCEHLVHLPGGGHSILLSPLPPPRSAGQHRARTAGRPARVRPRGRAAGSGPQDHIVLRPASGAAMKTTLIVATSIIVLVVLALAAAIGFGGPARAAPLASVNAPFAKVDYSAVPPARRFQARDGTSLAWLHYDSAGTPANGRRIVLVHGSSGRANSMHVLAQALARDGFTVAALDMRGHGDSGTRGQASYIGQLEDDIEDFMRAVPHAGPSTLLGFSSGGGFVLRVAGSSRQQLFDRYVLLAPFLRHDAPTNKPGNDDWAAVGLPRMIALTVLNQLGLRAWNDLPVLNFALDDRARPFLTPSYSFTLANAFGPGADYREDARNARGDVRLVAGADDELFDAPRYAQVLADAGRKVPVTLVPGIKHIGLTLEPAAVAAVVRACH